MNTAEEMLKVLKAIDKKLDILVRRGESPEEKAQREANVKGWADAARSQDSLAVSATTAEPMTVTVEKAEAEAEQPKQEYVTLTPEQMKTFKEFRR